ncbi:hypothetical protein [Cupriavidus sp. UYPR2.512]|uniref:hypothetical protein n=1 Tax=Cupriavidus sp. UYPR2.512 TaxID=1080187 RepID=UPI00036DE516|nr:hypothetical protein [Cupriavidus sp. UYPR2.512]
MKTVELSRKPAGVAGRLVAAGLLAAAGAGPAAAHTGTITFLGGISYPSCGFSPFAGRLQASCQQPSGRIVSAPLAMPPARMPGPVRIGVAKLDVEPAHTRQRSTPDAYVVVVTYQ